MNTSRKNSFVLAFRLLIGSLAIMLVINLAQFSDLENATAAPSLLTCNDVTDISSGDCDGLQAFYNSTNGPDWGNWFQSNVACEIWTGILCDYCVGCILDIHLSSKGISGTIAPQLADVSWDNLNLSHNNLTGQLPSGLANQSLDGIYLADNHLSGVIPAELGATFEIDLSRNRLSGSIPSFRYTESLDLSHNQLSGEIPASIMDLTWLYGLDLGYNKLQASDATLINWLNQEDPDWDQTQTVSPTNLLAQTNSSNTIELTWTPINYRADGGYYQISYGTTSSATGSSHTTSSKDTHSYVVSSLNPGTKYYFKVRTYTPAHGEQQNSLWSDYSNVVSATTNQECFTLSTSVNPSGTGSVNVSPSPDCSGGTYTAGTTVQLTATANDGYSFLNWSGDAGGNSTSTSVTMNGNRDVQANFSLLCYQLTRSHSGSGDDPVASPSKSNGCATGDYVPGEQISLTAVPGSGWHVAGWTGTQSNGSNSTNNTLTMPGNGHEVVVHYAQQPQVRFNSANYIVNEGSGIATIGVTLSTSSAQTVAVSYATENGTATADSDYTATGSTLTFNPGETSKSFAIPILDDGLEEENETVNLSLSAPANSTLGSPATATLTIADNEGPIECFALTLKHSGSGNDPTASPGSSSGCSLGQYIAGESIGLTAVPSSGWQVASWSGTSNDNSTSISNSVTMPLGVHTVTVHYEEKAISTQEILLPVISNRYITYFEGPWEAEDNDSYMKANGPLRSGQEYFGRPDDERDFFTIVIEEPGRISIDLLGHSGERVQLQLFYQTVGTNMPVAVDLSEDDHSYHISYPLETSATAAPGTYHIWIFTGDGYNNTPYTLRVTYPTS